jgi:hypothetical protein
MSVAYLFINAQIEKQPRYSLRCEWINLITCKQWSIIQWDIKQWRHGRTLNEYSWLKERNLKSLLNVWFQL